LPSAEELHAARHDTEDDTPAGRAVVCRRVDANARAAARAHIVALALVRIGDARGAVLRRTRIADTFGDRKVVEVGARFRLVPNRDRRHTSPRRGQRDQRRPRFSDTRQD
jgi:hypothetical protein